MRQRAFALGHRAQSLDNVNEAKGNSAEERAFDHWVTLLQGARLGSLEEGVLLPSREGIHSDERGSTR